MTPSTITVKIGDETRAYTLVFTNAPVGYDFGGTLELSAHGNLFAGTLERYVLVLTTSLNFQLSRYYSGLHTATPDDTISPNDLAARLFAAIVAGLAHGAQR